MQFLLTLVTMAAAIAATPHSLTRSEPVAVRKVIDGHTIDVKTVGRVRLLGLTSPKPVPGDPSMAAVAREARRRLEELVLLRWVRLEREGGVDARSRHVAYVVREDGLFVNAALVRDGLARVVAGGEGNARLEELKRAEAEARSFRRGLWGYTAFSTKFPARGRKKPKS